VDVDQARDHFPFSFPNSGHVDGEAGGADSKLFASLDVRRHLGAVNDVLAWQAGNIGAGSANILAFNYRHALPLLCKRPSKILRTFSTAQDDEVVILRETNTHSAILLFRRGSRPGGSYKQLLTIGKRDVATICPKCTVLRLVAFDDDFRSLW
jgi:hypothetical protein